MRECVDVAIIGGGFTGAVLAILLQRRLHPSRRIALFEPLPQGGRGVAYGTEEGCYLLNAPAAAMSALPDAPNDFRDWLAAHESEAGAEAGTGDGPGRGAADGGAGPGGAVAGVEGPAEEEDRVPPGPRFARRRLYGRYVAERLRAAIEAPGARLEHRRNAVRDVRPAPGGGWDVEAGGTVVRARACVLALGNAPAPRHPPGCAAEDGSFAGGAAAAAGSGPARPGATEVASGPVGAAAEAVLLVGSGLTMADNVLQLLSAGHRGPIRVVSRHGWMAAAHVEAPSDAPWVLRPPPFDLETGDGEAGVVPRLVPVMRWIRAEARRAAAAGVAWQEVMDALRPLTPALWRALPGAEKRRFLRHARTPWGQHRHRVAASVGRRLREARASGQLTIQAGRFAGCAPGAGGGIEARVRLRGQESEERWPVREVRLCTGVGRGAAWEAQAPTAAMLGRGTIRLDPWGIGLEADPDSCAMPDAAGRLAPNLFAVGPCAPGWWWEITAVAEIRRQAEALAKRLTGVDGLLAGAKSG